MSVYSSYCMQTGKPASRQLVGRPVAPPPHGMAVLSIRVCGKTNDTTGPSPFSFFLPGDWPFPPPSLASTAVSVLFRVRPSIEALAELPRPRHWTPCTQPAVMMAPTPRGSLRVGPRRRMLRCSGLQARQSGNHLNVYGTSVVNSSELRCLSRAPASRTRALSQTRPHILGPIGLAGAGRRGWGPLGGPECGTRPGDRTHFPRFWATSATAGHASRSCCPDATHCGHKIRHYGWQ